MDLELSQTPKLPQKQNNKELKAEVIDDLAAQYSTISAFLMFLEAPNEMTSSCTASTRAPETKVSQHFLIIRQDSRNKVSYLGSQSLLSNHALGPQATEMTLACCSLKDSRKIWPRPGRELTFDNQIDGERRLQA